MRKVDGWLLGFFASAIAGVSLLGCVGMGEPADGFERDDDCKFCHARYGADNAKDLAFAYDNPLGHHPIDILYPPTAGFSDKFNLPNARQGKNAYFDNNGNGKLDHDEVRLFPEDDGDEITCSTCHREHSKSPTPREEPDDDYLRGTNVDGELCMNCHRKQPKPIPHH